MSTARPFAYNPGTGITGTIQVGSLAVGFPTVGFEATGLEWWNGPDEDLGYVIAQSVPDDSQPTPLPETASVGFFRSEDLSDPSFISLSNVIGGLSGAGPFLSASSAKSWLNSNGYWTSYPEITTTTTTTLPPTTTTTTSTTTTSTTSTTTVASGIIQGDLFMKLDASNYTTGAWTDETGNGNNATINGATWQSTDGGIFDLDGTNDNISIPHNSSLSLSTTVQKTIQVWVKFDALGGFNQQIPVFGKLSSSFAFDGYWGGLFSNDGVIRCVTNGTSAQRISNSTLTVTTNTWYLMTFISQITSTSDTTKVYINETEYITTAHGADGYSESNPLYLGWIGSGVSSLYLNGKIGACYFYTKGLSVAEIGTNFNATKSKYGL